MSLKVTLTPLAQADALAREWQALEPEANGSFFTSWAWMADWLQHVPATLAPQVLRVQQAETTIALGLLIKRNFRRYGVLPVRAYYLHETGDRRLDELTIEYNGLLVRAGLEAQAWQAFIDYFHGRDDWDELYLSGLPAPLSSPFHIDNQPRKAYYVDLAHIRANGGDYLTALSANSKYQMRAALKAYEKTGPLRVDAALSAEQAQTYLDALMALHQKYWQGKGEGGAFGDVDFCQFHRRLIAAQYARGAVQVLRLCAGDTTIGYLYNLVWRGRVYNYQSGFAYDPTNKKKKPGFVCHYLAIKYHLERDARIYDFMAGDSQYKRSLSTHTDELSWLVLQKDRVLLGLERRLKKVKRWYRRRRAQASAAIDARRARQPS